MTTQAASVPAVKPTVALPVPKPEPETVQPAATNATTNDDQSLPLRGDLPINEQNNLPGLKIEAHIYDDAPAARMVIINGHMLREGQSIDDGLVLEAITEKGIVLNHQGTRFRMGVFDR